MKSVPKLYCRVSAGACRSGTIQPSVHCRPGSSGTPHLSSRSARSAFDQRPPLPDWDELDEGEIRQLDPDGLSLIAFQYDSSTAHYVFHLPFRIAEKFLSQQLIRELHTHASTSREVGTFYGRAITEAESQHYPIANLLRELLVDISAICPHGLAKRATFSLFSGLVCIGLA